MNVHSSAAQRQQHDKGNLFHGMKLGAKEVLALYQL